MTPVSCINVVAMLNMRPVIPHLAARTLYLLNEIKLLRTLDFSKCPCSSIHSTGRASLHQGIPEAKLSTDALRSDTPCPEIQSTGMLSPLFHTRSRCAVLSLLWFSQSQTVPCTRWLWLCSAAWQSLLDLCVSPPPSRRIQASGFEENQASI